MRRAHRGFDIGAAWVSLMEPDAGYDLAFNRWYSDDHFYAGGMNLPGIFAGRRWVCTRALQQFRFIGDTSLFPDLRDGKFLHTNLFARGSTVDVVKALGEVIAALFEAGRMHTAEIPRRHIYSRIQPWAASVYRDADAGKPLDLHALDYPYAGVVVEIIEAVGNRLAVVEGLVRSYIPRELDKCEADLCLVLLDEDLPEVLASRTKRIPSRYGDGPTQRLTLLWFTTSLPDVDWHQRFALHPELVRHSAEARMLFLSPFVPLEMGSDRYMDQLR